MSNSTEILPNSTEGLPFFELKYKLKTYYNNKRKVEIMDKVLKTTKSKDLLLLTPDEIMVVQGGEAKEETFKVLKKLVDALKKWGYQP